MTTMRTDAENKKILERFTELLPCDLTDKELLEYGYELGSVNQDINTEEDKQNSLKQEMKSRLASLEARRTELATKLTRKQELRDVEVEIVLDFDSDTHKKIRIDNGETVSERPIRDDERQGELV